MIPTFDSQYDFDTASEVLKALCVDLVARAPSTNTEERLPCDTVIGSATEAGDSPYYIVREGCLQIRAGDKVILILEEGEIVSPPPAPLSLTGPDFSIVVDVVPRTSVRDKSGDEWKESARIQAFYADMWLLVASAAIQASANVLPSTRVYQEGDTIIKQGEVASEVYTLLEGEADVYVDGVRVGEVQTNEFFGILASVTRGPRTATVKARSSCAVLCVDTERFQELIRARPVLIEKLIAELSRMIVDLNSRVVELSSSAEELRKEKIL